jgi:hypothetical protein
VTQSICDVTAKYNVRNARFYVDTVFQWLADYDDGSYLGCYSNKIGDVVVALYHNNTIYLLGEAYRTIMYAPKLMFRYIQIDHIHIEDVLVKHNNIGNGSIIMNSLILYANKCGIKKITGSLSSVDDDHKARRDNYYKKFGFDVKDTIVVKSMEGGDSCLKG